MEHVLSVNDLIVNDSFINYCYFKNPEDVSYWTRYILQNPAAKSNIEEARLFLLALKDTLITNEKEAELERFASALSDKTPSSPKGELSVVYMSPDVTPGSVKRRNYRWIAAASIVAVMAVSVWIASEKWDWISGERAKSEAITNQMLVENTVTRTGDKERKIVFLLDGTKVTMNGNTTLTVDSNFGMNTRLVKLDGEAFFDVQHDKRAPFIVQLKDFRIRVLGTMFNVRSYSGDRNSETALVKGKVEIEENESHHKLFLKPYEKAILPNSGIQKPVIRTDEKSDSKPSLPIVIKPLTISTDGVSISETAWMQNRLEINDESFLELKNKMERWFSVSIRFDDEEVKQLRFTATFEKENIDQALKAMQLSYPFKYTKKHNLIMIEK